MNILLALFTCKYFGYFIYIFPFIFIIRYGCVRVCVCLCQRWKIGHKKICLAGTWPKNVLLCHSNILSNENVAFMKLDKFADNLRNGTPNNRSNQTNVTMVFFSILFDIFNLFVFRFYVVYTQSVWATTRTYSQSFFACLIQFKVSCDQFSVALNTFAA